MAILLLVRWLGLRTLSKMTAIDFVVTLATGSLLATAAMAERWSSFAQALLALVAINLIQFCYARARRFASVRKLAENEPLLLVRGGKFVDAALGGARITREDIYAKLREADVRDLSVVAAVVLETTGDLSVLTNADCNASDLLHDVRRG
ncbi:DUF421 domain-containing protein [Sphingomonas japonica]|uniref:DUF421 domain-containing protein n=1 Tax=Sphingomonas japonica TaxID=511662 RepID=UPI001ABB8611